MELTDEQVDAIVEEVLDRLQHRLAKSVREELVRLAPTQSPGFAACHGQPERPNPTIATDNAGRRLRVGE